MDNLKNEFVSELLHVGFSPEEALRALSAFAIVARGYNVVPKEANIAVYDSTDATEKLIKLYIDCKRVEGCSKSFLSSLETILPLIFKKIGKDVRNISSLDVRGFLAVWQQERGISNATMDKYRQHISCFYEWLISEGYSGKNPCKSIKKIKQEKKEAEALGQMELEQIRMAVKTSRERMVIEVLYGTGCRVSELTGIKIKDIYFDYKPACIKVLGKGQKERFIPLTAKAVLAIKVYLDERGYSSPWLLANDRGEHLGVAPSTVRRIIRDIEARLGRELHHHLHPHLFRHTTITNAINHGMPLQEVQLMAGHSKIDTTMSYAKLDKERMMSDHQRFFAG